MKNTINTLLLIVAIFFESCSGNHKMDNNTGSSSSDKKIEISSYRLEDNFQVTINSFDKMTWNDAINLAKKVGNNWRLPTKEEFEILHRNQPTIQAKTQLFKGGYWTSTELDKDNAWQGSFEFGYLCEFYSKNQSAGVILVKTN